MLKLKGNEFKIKFTEMNIRQRMYQEKSYITFQVMTEFYPSLVGSSMIGGSIEMKLDLSDINSLDELVGKHYDGEIGNVVISVSNDGIWEHQSYDSFEIEFLDRIGRELKFRLKTDDCEMETTGVMVSLYTTSSSLEELNKNFSLDDFYDNPVVKEVNGKKIMKYFVKE